MTLEIHKKKLRMDSHPVGGIEKLRYYPTVFKFSGLELGVFGWGFWVGSSPLPPYGSDRSKNSMKRSGISSAFQQALICLSAAKKTIKLHEKPQKTTVTPHFTITLLQMWSRYIQM